MATIALTRQDIGAGYAIMVTWNGLANGDDGAALDAPEYGDRCVQFAGTFGSGTAVLEGSNDGTNWFTLNDAGNSAISKTAASIETVLEVPRFMRPRLSGGTAGALVVTLYCRRTQR